MVILLASALALRTASGAIETIAPANDRKATVVFVGLIGCPNAQAYSPEMARLARDYGKKGIRFVMAFYDAKPTEMKTQMKEFGLGFTAAHADDALVRRLGAKAVPTAALITSKGEIYYVGRIDDRFPKLGVRRKPRRADLRLALDAFLAGKKVGISRTPVIGCLLPNG